MKVLQCSLALASMAATAALAAGCQSTADVRASSGIQSDVEAPQSANAALRGQMNNTRAMGNTGSSASDLIAP